MLFSEPTAEERVFRRYLLRETQRELEEQGHAKVSNPTGLLVVGSKLYASEFRENRVLVASSARSQKDTSWRIFADRGPHCKRHQDRIDCGILDGPWGLATHKQELFVASFGSDQILAFSLKKKRFERSLGSSDSLDSPEGLAVRGTTLFAASFLDSRIVAFDLSDDSSRTIAAGDPVDIDIEAGVFVDAAADVVEARRSLWGLSSTEHHRRLPLLKGPEHVLLTSRGSLLVSSLHNQSLVEIDLLEPPRILRGDLGSIADGPLGIALVSDSHTADLVRRRANLPSFHDDADPSDLLLVASYRTDEVFAVEFDGTAKSLRLTSTDDDLRGPAALALDPHDPGGIYIACYESGAVLYFNLSHTTTGGHVVSHSDWRSRMQ